MLGAERKGRGRGRGSRRRAEGVRRVRRWRESGMVEKCFVRRAGELDWRGAEVSEK